jgi:hypothetical protein
MCAMQSSLLLHAVVVATVATVHTAAPPAPPTPPTPSSCGEGCKRWVFDDAVDTHGARCLDGELPLSATVCAPLHESLLQWVSICIRCMWPLS